MNNNTKHLTLCAVMISVALVLSYIERFLPLQLLIPLPGIKLGLANIVSLMALFFWGTKYAFIILILRCLLGAVFSGTVSGLFFSLTGGVTAMLVMRFAKQSERISVYGVSILGAAAHNIGQIAAAVFLMNSIYVIGYLPYLLVLSVITGMITGTVCAGVFRILQKSGQVPEMETEKHKVET